MKIDFFSQQEIKIIANRAFGGKQVKVLDCHLVTFSDEKVGFLGTHKNLKMIIKRAGKSRVEEYRFFVKSMPQMTEDQLLKLRDNNVFAKEAAYFNDVLPLLKKSCPKAEDWCPKCLLASDEFVVLEDMRLRNYAMSSAKLLNEDQLRAAFMAQARLHAASLVAEKQLAKPLNQVCPKAWVEPLFNDAFVENNYLDLYVDLAEKVAERLGLDKGRIDAGFRKGFYQMHDQSRLSSRLPKVLEHGDAWSNNYVFDKSNPSKCVIVDFQFTRYGPLMYDSVLLAYLATSREFRDEAIRRALESYHQQLCEVLERNDPEIAKPTLEDILGEYEELKTTAFVMGVMYYPIIAVGKSCLSRYTDEELYARIMFRQENDFVMQIYDEDEAFAERMNDLVEEAVEHFQQIGVSAELENDLH